MLHAYAQPLRSHLEIIDGLLAICDRQQLRRLVPCICVLEEAAC